jgi:hydrogenase expression/formation protein HypE
VTALACPLPIGSYDYVVLAHGAGGRLSQALLEQVFLAAFDNPVIRAVEDQATLPGPRERIAVTTDAFVVSPRRFLGGDIGKLAACGTINDLVVGGAVPRYMTCAFVLEEGLSIAELAGYVHSLAATCREAGVAVVAGDTKVVERGKGDGVFIATTGVGIVPDGRSLSWHAGRPGDRVIVSGPIGDHGTAILAERQRLELEPPIASDCAPLHQLAELAIASGGVRGMRDPTRGGVASALNELAAASRVGVMIDEPAIPVRPGVRATCELLGLDPLYVACEGRLVIVVDPTRADAVVDALRAHPQGARASIIGELTSDHAGVVAARSSLGSTRVIALLAGDQLPRIC